MVFDKIKRIWDDWAIYSLFLGVLVYAISFVVNTFKPPQIIFSAQSIDVRQLIEQTSVNPEVSKGITDLLSGAISNTFAGAIGAILGTAAVILVGRILVGLIIESFVKLSRMTTLVLSIVVGSLILGMVAVNMYAIPGTLITIALVLYALALWGAATLVESIGGFKIPERR